MHVCVCVIRSGRTAFVSDYHVTAVVKAATVQRFIAKKKKKKEERKEEKKYEEEEERKEKEK